MSINLLGLNEMIRELAGNTIFSVKFVKRTNGELRTMVCRLNCNKDVNGKGSAYDPIEKGLLRVWDIQKSGWRMIPLDAIQQIKMHGQTYSF